MSLTGHRSFRLNGNLANFEFIEPLKNLTLIVLKINKLLVTFLEKIGAKTSGVFCQF